MAEPRKTKARLDAEIKQARVQLGIDRLNAVDTTASKARYDALVAERDAKPAGRSKSASTKSSAEPPAPKSSPARAAASAAFEKEFGRSPSPKLSIAEMKRQVQRADLQRRLAPGAGAPSAPPAANVTPAAQARQSASAEYEKAFGKPPPARMSAAAMQKQVQKAAMQSARDKAKSAAIAQYLGAPTPPAALTPSAAAPSVTAASAQSKPPDSKLRAVSKVAPALSVLAPLGAVAAGALAFDAAQSEASAAGATSGEAIAKGAAAAVPAVAVAAGAGLVIGKGVQAAAALLPKVAPFLGPVGVAVAAATTAYGAVEGYRKTGTVAGAAFGALTMGEVPESMKPSASAPQSTGAYLNDAAERKAEATPMQAPAPMAASPVAEPRADGMTEGYIATRRTASGTIQVQVGGYKTPGR